MNYNVSFSSLGIFKKLPEDVKNIICNYIPADQMQGCYINKNSRDEFYKKLQNETDLKIGLYQKSLMMEGIPWINEKMDIEHEIKKNSLAKEEWDPKIKILFQKVLNGEAGMAKTLLEAFSQFNKSAREALEQLDLQQVLKIQENIAEEKLTPIREKRLTEKNIYILCGGKKKFNDLKILDLNEQNSKIFFNTINAIYNLNNGSSVMRGILEDQSYFEKYAFIAFKYKEIIGPDCATDEKIAVFQEYTGRKGNWLGSHLPLILSSTSDAQSPYCHLNTSPPSSFFGRLKELITTGKTSNDQNKVELVVQTEHYAPHNH
ncbi:MAG: hypothetical protein H0V82_03855 [Candidatus Protochlamydia sp.]|nr:hypothetical protein [Candidatus Protochlamydia sp.]